MSTPEVFYIHLQGEQRGPYTLPQIDHLLNSGLIARETLYWREGLEQWQPVTDLVIVRKRANPWIKPAIALAIVLVLSLLARLFGPIAMDGWRETNQHEYTQEAAYWRAREVVRNNALPAGSIVEFAEFDAAQIWLLPPAAATVTVHGEVTDSEGATRLSAWNVAMRYDAKTQEWAGELPAEIAATR